eukprot:m.232831 g.232831  ORF g.232831 m.232831 type:complete len:445 (-) comp18881_c0_seq1:36-1370(-)
MAMSELPRASSVSVAVVDEEESFFDARSRTPSVELDELTLTSGGNGVVKAEEGVAAAPLTPEERALLVERVRALIDFYFGDANFSKDQFLRKHASSDPQGEGWISVELVCSFKKMKLLTTDASVVLDGMKKSDVVVLNAAQDKIKRKEPMENFIEDVLARTIHLSVPRETSEASLRELCAPFGEIARLRVLDPTTTALPAEIAEHCVDEQGHPRFRQLPGMMSAFVQYGSIKQAGVASRALNAKKDWRYPVHVDLIFMKNKSTGASPAHSREASPHPSHRYRSNTTASSGHHSPLAFADPAAAALYQSPTGAAPGSPPRMRSSSFTVRRSSPATGDVPVHAHATELQVSSPIAGGLSPGARRRYLSPASGAGGNSSGPGSGVTGYGGGSPAMRSGLSQVESPEAWRRASPITRAQAVVRNPTGPTAGRGFARHSAGAATGTCPW